MPQSLVKNLIHLTAIQTVGEESGARATAEWKGDWSWKGVDPFHATRAECARLREALDKVGEGHRRWVDHSDLAQELRVPQKWREEAFHSLQARQRIA